MYQAAKLEALHVHFGPYRTAKACEHQEVSAELLNPELRVWVWVTEYAPSLSVRYILLLSVKLAAFNLCVNAVSDGNRHFTTCLLYNFESGCTFFLWSPLGPKTCTEQQLTDWQTNTRLVFLGPGNTVSTNSNTSVVIASFASSYPTAISASSFLAVLKNGAAADVTDVASYPGSDSVYIVTVGIFLPGSPISQGLFLELLGSNVSSLQNCLKFSH